MSRVVQFQVSPARDGGYDELFVLAEDGTLYSRMLPDGPWAKLPVPAEVARVSGSVGGQTGERRQDFIPEAKQIMSHAFRSGQVSGKATALRACREVLKKEWLVVDAGTDVSMLLSRMIRDYDDRIARVESHPLSMAEHLPAEARG